MRGWGTSETGTGAAGNGGFETMPLDRVAPFSSLSGPDLSVITSASSLCLARCDAVLGASDEAAGRVVVLEGGHAVLYLDLEAERRLALRDIRGGDVLTWPSVPGPAGLRLFLAVGREGAVLRRLCGETLDDISGRDPRFAAGMAQLRADEATELACKVIHFGLYDFSTRLWYRLYEVSRCNADHWISDTHQQLADAVGAYRWDVTKKVHQLADSGLVRRVPHRHGMFVPEPEALVAGHSELREVAGRASYPS